VPSAHPKGKSKTVAAEQPPDPLQLTDAQKAMIKAICLDAVRQPQTAVVKGKGGGGALGKVMRAVRDQVLSQDQNNALAAAQLQQQVMGQALAGVGVKGNGALKLSGQQLAQIRAICRDAARDLAPAGDEKINPEAVRGVAEQVQDVLTPEQREEVNRRLEGRRAKKPKGHGVKQPSGDKGAKPLGGDGAKSK
jgi:Spy/CpxP family protein refolding chaperone